jgi:carbon monoxide dehydrogenase subunit G
MKYSCEITIDKPRDQVIALFDNPDNMVKWQEGFVSFTHRSGEPGQPGAVSDLVYQMGKRRVEMVETVVARDLPDRFCGTYEAKGVWNSVDNHFAEQPGGRTHWRLETEFRLKGFMAIIGLLMPGMFRKQSMKFMKDFKAFAEGA